MEFYFNIKDYYHEPIANPSTPYNSISAAAIEAKRYLVPQNTSDGYYIDIFEQSPEERIAMALQRDLPPVPAYSEFITQGEISAFAQTEGAKVTYPEWIMNKVRQRLGLEPGDMSKDSEINDMTHDSVLDHCLEWEGIIGYGYTIRGWIKDIYGIDLAGR